MSRKFYEAKVIRPKNMRNRFRVLTDAGFKEMIKDFCEIYGPKDAEIYLSDDYSARINVERSFSVEATLYINIRIDWGGHNYGQDDDGKWWRINDAKLNVEMNWAGASRSLAAAAAAMQLYTELTNLGNNICAALEGYRLALLRELTDEQVAELDEKTKVK